MSVFHLATGLSIIGCLLITQCSESPKEEPKIAPRDNLELRMAGSDSRGREGKIFLSALISQISNNLYLIYNDSLFLRNRESLKTVDSIATSLSSRLFMESDPYKIIEELKKSVFLELQLKVDDKRNNYENTIPHLVLHSKQGNHLGVALIILMITEKADLPLFGAITDNHLFLRFDNGKKAYNVELSKYGEIMPDSWYTTKYASAGGKDGFFRKVDSRDLVGLLFHDIALIAAKEKKAEASVKCMTLALHHSQCSPTIMNDLSKLIDNEKDSKRILEIVLQEKAKFSDLSCLDRKVAVLYLRNDMYADAAVLYEQLITRYPDDISLQREAGIAYLNLHDFSNARLHFKKVLTVLPGDSQTIDLLAKCPE